MISVNMRNSNLQSTVESLLSLCGLNDADIMICDEDSAADMASCDGGIIVLYKKGAYLYSETHGKLSKLYGDKYRAVSCPIDYAQFCQTVMTLSTDVKLTSAVPSSTVRDAVIISEDQCTLMCGERSVQLTDREMALFIYLHAHIGKAVSRQVLKSEVWGNRTDEGTNVVDVYVSYLRRKLKPILGEGAIISVRGQGYMLNLPRE